MTCNVGCYNKMMDQMKGSTDENSLASQRIYESQTAERRCISSNNECESCNGVSEAVQERPIGAPYFSRSKPLSRYSAIEGFNCNFDMKTILKWVIIGLLVYLILSMITDAQRKPIILVGVEQNGGALMSDVDILAGIFD